MSQSLFILFRSHSRIKSNDARRGMISILLRLHKCESYSSNDKYNNNAKETIKGRLRIEMEPFVFRVIRHHLLRDKERVRRIQAAGGDRVEGEEQGKSTRYKQGETRAAGAWL
jgi:hypothetical protein